VFASLVGMLGALFVLVLAVSRLPLSALGRSPRAPPLSIFFPSCVAAREAARTPPRPDGHGYASADALTVVHIYAQQGESVGDLINAHHSLCSQPLDGFMAWREVPESRVCPRCWDAWFRLSMLAACHRSGVDFFDFMPVPARYSRSLRSSVPVPQPGATRASVGDTAGREAAGFINKSIIHRALPNELSPCVTIAAYKTDVRVSRTLLNPRSRHGVTKRGRITAMSSKSLRNLVFSVRNIPVQLRHMITLTYPAAFPATGREVKHHWDVFLKCLRRKYPDVAGVWFLEFQARGAPHLHLLLNKSVNRLWLSRVWYRVVDSGDVSHMLAGTRAEQLREVHAAMAYVSKYAAKMDQKEVPEGFTDVGRFWGVFGTSINAEQVVQVPNRSDASVPVAFSTDDFAASIYRARALAVRQVVRVARRLVERFRASMGFKRRRVDNGTSGFVAHNLAAPLRRLLASIPALPSLPLPAPVASEFRDQAANYVISGQFAHDLAMIKTADCAA
jgi:hypothetical protein